jgi:hypothetical protein
MEASEKDLVLVARGLVELTDLLVAARTSSYTEGPGLTFARQLVSEADEGLRGLRAGEHERSILPPKQPPEPWNVDVGRGEPPRGRRPHE